MWQTLQGKQYFENRPAVNEVAFVPRKKNCSAIRLTYGLTQGPVGSVFDANSVLSLIEAINMVIFMRLEELESWVGMQPRRTAARNTECWF